MHKPVSFLALALSISAIQAEKSSHLGEKLPDFTLISAQEDTVSLSDYEGGTVMLFTMGYG